MAHPNDHSRRILSKEKSKLVLVPANSKKTAPPIGSYILALKTFP